MIFKEADKDREWRDGVYLCTAATSLEADLLESKLRSENIPSVKRYKGASFMEAAFGASTTFPIDIYVPEETLEDARNVIEPISLDECEPVDFGEEKE